MKQFKAIIRNTTVNYLYDVVTLETSKDGLFVVDTQAQGLTFAQAQVLMGVDPEEVVLDSEGDVV